MVAVQYSPRCETPSVDRSKNRCDRVSNRLTRNAPQFPCVIPKCRHALLPKDALECFLAEDYTMFLPPQPEKRWKE